MIEKLAGDIPGDIKTTDYVQRLETLLENLPGMAYRCLNLPHWPMDFVSNGCFELCGYDRCEIESQDILWGDFTHPDDLDEVDTLVRAAADLRQPFEIEYRIITRNGSVKWVWERGRVINVRTDGVAIIEGFITDITDRKHSETQLVHAEAYAQAIVESAAEAVITIEQAGNIISLNRAAKSMFGRMAREVEDTSFDKLLCPSHRSEFKRILDDLRGAHTTISSGHDLQGQRIDGVVFPIELSINRIDIQLADRYVILIRDLTRRRQDEAQLREHRRLLAHADRVNTLGEMAAGIAHEINQPLAAISTYAQSSLRFLKSNPARLGRLEDGLEKLSAQAKRAGDIIQRVQTMATRHETERETINATTLIRDMYRFAELEAYSRNYAIILCLPDRLPEVSCDVVQIQQVLLNLLRNGMKSMRSAGCPRGDRLLIKAEVDDSGVKISVIDKGQGISEALAERLFQPFQSTNRYGMGMGLAISRSIVTAHGSTLSFMNNPDNGATFFFTLPLARGQAQ